MSVPDHATERPDGRQARWDRHNHERHQHIVGAAIAVIEENEPGTHIHLRQIADRAGLTRSVIYRHFADRADLDRAVLTAVVDSLADELLPAAYALARSFVDGHSPVATALMRQMMYRNSAAPDPVEAHRIESLAMFYASLGDGKEGVAAFLGKRPAKFTGRVPEDLPPFYPW